LRMEREILKKAAVFFAKERKRLADPHRQTLLIMI
jgi:transposase-like protein